MGGIVTPECKCGKTFEDLYLGGGMKNFTVSCAVPAPCFHCGTIGTVNLFKKSHTCPKCRRKVNYYGEVTVGNFTKLSPKFYWRFDDEKTYFIENKKYRCPGCKEENLEFYNSGYWD